MTAEYVEPYVDSVDAIEPPAVEYVEPFVESVESEVPIEEPVLPIFSPDDSSTPPEPDPPPEPEPDPGPQAQSASTKKSSKR